MCGYFRVLLLCVIVAVVSACSANSYWNEGPVEATVVQRDPDTWPYAGCFRRSRPWDDRVLALTISGGGARAAVFGAAVMFELQDMGVLQDVDFVSSVSGGSLAAALYGLSHDAGSAATYPSDIVWEREKILSMAGQNLIAPWVYRWFWPQNFARYWLTAYDRTDLFADTLDGALFEGSGGGDHAPTFRDLNPDRPMIILNSTNFTNGRDSDVFTFTPDSFEKLHSDICSYGVARAVAASAAFPGFLSYSTLGVFAGGSATPSAYVHLMDGGATDNLGIKGLNLVMRNLTACDDNAPATRLRCARRLVLIVDAQNGFEGRGSADPDPRGWDGKFVDKNFLDSYDTLMQAGYGQLLRTFREDMDSSHSGEPDGAGVVHLPLKTFIPTDSERETGDWYFYDGQYWPYANCSGSTEQSAHGAGDNRTLADLRRACALEQGARNLVATADRRVLGQKLRKIDTDWTIEQDEVACLLVAAHALVAGARPQLESFFQRRLGEQKDGPYQQALSECLSPGRG